MFVELGHFALIIALLFSILLAVYPLWGSFKGDVRLVNLAKPLAVGVFLFTLMSYLCLTYAFIVDDFSVMYVASTSNSQLPLYYKITAVWGSHEGSFLLWVLIFSVWTVAVASLSKGIPNEMVARVLAILGMVAIGFYLYILLASNPFERLLPFYPIDGRDLNPLLQDFGMIIHPPMLYMGYVGFSVAFAFAVAALLSGQLDSTWARWSRPWTIAAWCFLTFGIMLGSWWAYNELGWGGWWFWDPSENAALMPWLAGTALMHSLAVTEKRKAFKSWSVFLAISAFSLSLLGTFLIRSGVIVSVHAFASDPTRGLFILGLLVVVIGGSLLLYALRASQLKSYSKYEFVSREVMLVGNNILLCAATLVVLLGTLLPMVHKELGLGSISIGQPFFNQMFTILIVPFVFLMALGPLSRWKQQRLGDLKNHLLLAFGISIAGGALTLVMFEQKSYLAMLGMVLSIFILVSTLQEVKLRLGKQQITQSALVKLGRSHWGMALGHVGFAVMLIGITLTSNFSEELDVRMGFGETVQLAGYEFEFLNVEPIDGPNYSGHVGQVLVTKRAKEVAKLGAEKRFYTVQQMTMTEAGINSGVTRDLFVALGEQLPNGEWALRIYVKPFINWIWFGAIVMVIGGVLSMTDKRYRLAKKAAKLEEKASAPVGKEASA